ncbi:hypothetical protein [Laceyella sacchari]|uniref:Uncharacterized protein n=1 Tax=Laceyella sacchari TaxID=37482 RepID=A0ABY5U6P3_LACSH|nr:hypothetical protein [Laceyella sacchari]UWE05302.1 hypothetical protein NYR52_16650 [Laceyella sacchari]
MRSWDAKINFTLADQKMTTDLPINNVADFDTAMEKANQWAKALIRMGASIEKINVKAVEGFEMAETDGPF